MNRRHRTLVDNANRRISRLGGTVAPGFIVCPTCLRRVSVESATEGHYPARSAPAVRRRTELQCSDCNGRIGGTYENAGVDLMKYVRTVTMTRPGVEATALRRQAIVRNTEGGGVSVDLLSRKGKRPNARHGEHAHTQLDRVLAGSADPRELAVTIERPTDDPAKRAILAWSFLALFYYAGYRYAASAGAEQVRQLILDLNLPLPAGLVYTKGSIAMPLAAPEPVLVVRVEDGEEVEVIALGVVRDRLVVVFPFASDHDDRSWSRIAELLAFDALKTTEVRPLRINHPSMAKELTELLEVRVDDGVRHAVNGDLSPVEVEALAAGVSPRRLDPRAGGSWRTSMQVEHEFITVEGEAPKPNRVAHWRSSSPSSPRWPSHICDHARSAARNALRRLIV